MAIAFDAVGGGNSDTSSPYSMTWSHTAAGGVDCVVLIGFQLVPTFNTTNARREQYTPTVTYGGTACHFLAYNNVGTGDIWGCTYWFAMWNPPTGSQTVSVAITGGNGGLIGNSVSYTGVSAVRRLDGNSGSSNTPSITVPTVSGRYYVHAGTDVNGSFSSYSQTQRWRDANPDNMVIGDAAGNGSNKTFSWSATNGAWGHEVVELTPTTEIHPVELLSVGLGVEMTGNSSTLSTSYNHYISTSGTSCVVIVGVTLGLSSSTDSHTCSVSFGGQSMTLEAQLYGGTTASTYESVHLFSLRNPPTGNSSVDISTGGAGSKRGITACSVAYWGVNAISTAQTATSTSMTITPQDTYSRAVYMCGNSGSDFGYPAGYNDLWRWGRTVSGGGDNMVMIDAMATEPNAAINFNPPTSGSLPLSLGLYLTAPLSVTVTPSGASLALTGGTPSVVVSVNQFVQPTGATLTLSGSAPKLDFHYKPTGASLALSGGTPTVLLSNNKIVQPTGAALALSGGAPKLDFHIRPTGGSLALSGGTPAVSLSNNQVVTPAGATLTLAGSAPRLDFHYKPSGASLTLTGGTPAITNSNHKVVVSVPGSLTLSGSAPTLVLPQTVAPSGGSLTLSGGTPAVSLGLRVYPTGASLVLTGGTPSVLAPLNPLTPGAATLSLTGYAPTVVNTGGMYVAPTAATLALTGSTPTVLTPQLAQPAGATLALSGGTPVVLVPRLVQPTQASLALTGTAPIVLSPRLVQPPGATLALSAGVPTVTAIGSQVVQPADGTLTLTGGVPFLSASQRLVPDGAVLTLTMGVPRVGAAEPAGPSPVYRTAVIPGENRYVAVEEEQRSATIAAEGWRSALV